MPNTIVRKCTITAHQLRDGMLLNFDDDNPGMVSNVKHVVNKVLFRARNTEWTVDRDEILYTVVIMRVVG